ncbi:flagellar basal body rod protein FlgB [Frateuria aurantia]
MDSSLSTPFGMHPDALSLWERRTTVLANNLSNANTPGYEARDIDFQAALAQEATGSSETLALETTQPDDISNVAASPAAAELLYRRPMQPSMDGNTVDTQLEDAAYAENTVHYQASLSFINAQVQLLKTAITGTVS